MKKDQTWTAERMVREILRARKKLEKKGGPEKNARLFELVIGLEEDLLELFDMSPTSENTLLIESLTHPGTPDSIAPTLCELLRIRSAGEARRSPIEAYAEGLHTGDAPYDVLARMGFPCHGYLEHLFTLATLQPELILETYNEMCRAEKYLSEIYLLGEAFAKLEAKHLEYLRSYLDSCVRTES